MKLLLFLFVANLLYPLVEHEVTEGESLWKISQKYYSDPFKWRLIYQENAEKISDPNLIFPGQKLSIPGIIEQEVVVSTEPLKVEISTPVTVLTPLVRKEKIHTISFVAPFDWEPKGMIIGAKEKNRELLSTGDIVYIDLGSEHGVNKGDRFYIFHPVEDIKHPETKEIWGINMKMVGVLKVSDEIADETSTAMIIKARDPVRVGDLIIPLR